MSHGSRTVHASAQGRNVRGVKGATGSGGKSTLVPAPVRPPGLPLLPAELRAFRAPPDTEVAEYSAVRAVLYAGHPHRPVHQRPPATVSGLAAHAGRDCAPSRRRGAGSPARPEDARELEPGDLDGADGIQCLSHLQRASGRLRLPIRARLHADHSGRCRLRHLLWRSRPSRLYGDVAVPATVLGLRGWRSPEVALRHARRRHGDVLPQRRGDGHRLDVLHNLQLGHPAGVPLSRRRRLRSHSAGVADRYRLPDGKPLSHRHDAGDDLPRRLRADHDVGDEPELRQAVLAGRVAGRLGRSGRGELEQPDDQRPRSAPAGRCSRRRRDSGRRSRADRGL